MPDDEQPDPVDQLAVMRAQIDQMAMLAPDIAKLAHNWFHTFRAQGFDDKQALYMAAVQMIQNPGVPPA
jgi:hypothetical protein